MPVGWLLACLAYGFVDRHLIPLSFTIVNFTFSEDDAGQCGRQSAFGCFLPPVASARSQKQNQSTEQEPIAKSKAPAFKVVCVGFLFSDVEAVAQSFAFRVKVVSALKKTKIPSISKGTAQFQCDLYIMTCPDKLGNVQAV